MNERLRSGFHVNKFYTNKNMKYQSYTLAQKKGGLVTSAEHKIELVVSSC